MKTINNRRIAKLFEQGLYFGTVNYYDNRRKLWRIDYDDNDSEDFDRQEIVKALQLYDREKKRIQ